MNLERNIINELMVNYKNHDIHSSLKFAKERVENLLQTEFSREITLELYRTKTIVDFIEKVLYKSNYKYLIDEKILTNIAKHLIDLSNNLKDFQETLSFSKDIDKFASFKSLNSIVLNDLKDLSVLLIPNMLNELNNSDEFISNKKWVQKQVNNMEETVKSQKDRFDALLDHMNHEYRNTNSNLKDKLYNSEKEFEEARIKLETKTAEISNKYIGELEVIKKDVQETAALIGGTVLSDHYGRTANSAQTKAFWGLGIIAVLLIIIGTTGYVAAFKTTYTQELVWIQFLPKILFISVIAIAIKYTANQIQFFQDIELKNRKIQLELAVLDSYLAVFQKEDANKLREKLAANYFIGHTESKNDKKEGLEFEHWCKPIIDLLKDLLKKKSS